MAIESQKNGKTGGISYSDNEESTVKRINEASKSVNDANLLIGKAVDDLVADKGGTEYGDRTLDRLSKHPSLDCSREHLRRCWQYYRLTRRYGDELKKTAPALKYSHQYQLSRLLDIEDEGVQRTAVLAFAKKVVDDGMTATTLAQAVTTHLKSIGRAMHGTGVAMESPKGMKMDPIPPNAYEVLIDTSKTLVEAAKLLASAETIEHFIEVRGATLSLGLAYVQIVGRLASGDEESLDDARKVAASLAEAIESVQKEKVKSNG